MVKSVTKAANDAVSYLLCMPPHSHWSLTVALQENLGVVKSLIDVFGRLEVPILRLLEETFPTLLFRAL